MSQFAFTDLPLAGLKLIERQRLGEIRGFLSRLLCAEELAAADPVRLAHSFQALTDAVEPLYCHSAAYNASAEAGLNPQDVRLAINWSRPITELSNRDAGQALIETRFKGVSL
jgi:dTDP-4-dehydrorhamnose 3,5-epimerase